MARTQMFRGYRSLTTGFSAVVAVVAAAWQGPWLQKPVKQVDDYLLLWVAAAAVCVGVVGMEMFLRGRRQAGLQKELMLEAVEQFLPSIVAGGLLTYVIWDGAPAVAWMLPGLWLMFFGMGIFASRRVLPRQAFWIAAYYLLAGLAALMWGQGDAAAAFCPGLMGLGFGAGANDDGGDALLEIGAWPWALKIKLPGGLHMTGWSA